MSDANWRELPDPELPRYMWRCKLFVLEYAYKFDDHTWSRWFNHHDYPHAVMFKMPTAARKALWADLFVSP